MSFYVSTATLFLLHCDEWDRVVALPRHKFVTGATLLQLDIYMRISIRKLTSGNNCLPSSRAPGFISVFCGVPDAHLFSFLWCVFCFVCLRPVSCVPNAATVSKLYILKKSLKIPMGQSEYVYRKRTDNTMAKRKSTKGQTTIYKTYI